MSNKLYEEEDIRNIATAIRTKNGTTNTYNVSQMADAILDLSADSSEGGITPTGSIEIKTNGTHDVTKYAEANVNVQVEATSIQPWATGTFGYDENCNGSTVKTIQHNLGFAPSRIVVWVDEYTDVESGAATVGGHILGNSQGHIRNSSGEIQYNATCPIINITDTTFDFGGMPATYWYYKDYTYRWFAME